MLEIKDKITKSKAPIIVLSGNIFDIFPPYRNLHEHLQAELSEHFEKIEIADTSVLADNEVHERFIPKDEMLLDLEKIKEELDQSESLCLIVDISTSADCYAKESLLLGMGRLFYEDSIGKNKLILIAREGDFELLKQFGSAVEKIAIGLPEREEIDSYLATLCPELSEQRRLIVLKCLLESDFRKIRGMAKDLYQIATDNDKFESFLNDTGLYESKDKITFSDVAGLENVKSELRKSMHVIKYHDDLSKHEKNTPYHNAILLAGLPGTGKTYVSKAISSELDAKFVEFKLNETLSEYYGMSERNVADFFARIQEMSKKQPLVVFFDEADSIMAKRTDHDSTSTRVVSVLLTELQRILENPRVFVILATNRPWNIDSGISRSKRVGKSLYIPLPDAKARYELIKTKERGKVNLDYDFIVEATDGFNSADVCTLYSEANIIRSQRGGDTLETQDFTEALKSARSTVRSEDIVQMQKWIKDNNISFTHI